MNTKDTVDLKSTGHHVYRYCMNCVMYEPSEDGNLGQGFCVRHDSYTHDWRIACKSFAADDNI